MTRPATAVTNGYEKVPEGSFHRWNDIKMTARDFRRDHPDLSVICVVDCGFYYLYAKPKGERLQDKYERTLVEVLSMEISFSVRDKIRTALGLGLEAREEKTMETKLVIFRHEPKQKTTAKSFGLNSEEWHAKMTGSLLAFCSGDETNMADTFVRMIKDDVFTGSELMALALIGWKSPLDTMRILQDPEMRELGAIGEDMFNEFMKRQ